MRHLFILALAFSLIGCQKPPDEIEFESAEARRIINGVGSSVGGVGMLSGSSSLCTAIEVSNRCLVTAAHCQNTFARYFQSASPDSSKDPYIPVVKTQILKNETNRDLAVVWLGRSVCDGKSGLCEQQESKYSPLALALPKA